MPGGRHSGDPNSSWARAKESPEATEETVKAPESGPQYSKIVEFPYGSHSTCCVVLSVQVGEG